MSRMEHTQPETGILDRIFLDSVPLIDVRSPGEFATGHFPSSVNLPILNDEERRLVGTSYKQEGQDAAIALGHNLVSGSIREQRIQAWVDFVEKNPTSLLYCARGGLRSQISRQWISEAGIRMDRVPGGYKSLRNHLLGRMPELLSKLSFRIIGGKTGSGKTGFLKEAGLPFIDLEALANHKGSSFGGMGEQPAQATFENALIIELLRLDPEFPVLLEDESIMIGAISLPNQVHSKMKSSPLWVLEASLMERSANIARDYVTPRLLEDPSPPENTRKFFLEGLRRIAKKLGSQRTMEIESQIHDAFAGDHYRDPKRHFAWIEALLVHYYDPYYERGLEKSRARLAGRGTKMELASVLALS
jgi:tRNA 2-selenouridine synthase